MPVGIVVERREIDNEWQSHEWKPISVIVGAPEISEWRALATGEGWAHYHAATLELELFRKETESYLVNLANQPPLLYIVLRTTDDDLDAEHEIVPFLVTASAFESQDYLDSGEDIVEGIPMPDGIIAWVQKYIDEHHVDEPFIKRKRKARGDEPEPFDRQPLVGNRRWRGHG